MNSIWPDLEGSSQSPVDGKTADQSQMDGNTANQSQVDGNTDDQSQADGNTANQAQADGNTANQAQEDSKDSTLAWEVGLKKISFFFSWECHTSCLVPNGIFLETKWRLEGVFLAHHTPNCRRLVFQKKKGFG